MKAITINEIRNSGTSAYSVKDDSARGIKTVAAAAVKAGDMVIINNAFALVVDTPAAQPEAAEDAPAINAWNPDTADILTRAAEIVNNSGKGGSCWNKAVTAYAIEILGNLSELSPEQMTDRAAIYAALLNGARDWSAYSWGGCSLIYDTDIAARVCTPSDLRRKKGGELAPNSREQWLDVQARALRQAAGRVSIAVADAVKQRG